MDEEQRAALGITELAMRVGVTPRTVRYYVAEGLLPPPGGGGQQRVYTHEHLLRLQAIKRLKEAYLPLGEIRRQLSGASLTDLERLASNPPSSALDYIDSILPASQRSDLPRDQTQGASAEGVEGEAGTTTGLPPDSVWRRVVLAPGVELHYQISDERDRDLAVARLIREAARLLAGSQPPGGSHT